MPTSATALLAAAGRVEVMAVAMVVATVEVMEVRVPVAAVKGVVPMATMAATWVEASVGLPSPDSNSAGV